MTTMTVQHSLHFTKVVFGRYNILLYSQRDCVTVQPGRSNLCDYLGGIVVELFYTTTSQTNSR